MTDKPELELLIEIAKLLKKYSPELSESIAKQLSSPELVKRLVSVLSTIDKIPQTVLTQEIQPAASNQSLKKSYSSLTKGARKSGKKESHSAKGKQTRSNSYPSFLNELEKTEPDKSALLVKFYDGLMDRTFLATLQEMRNFSSDTGLPPVKATSRNKAIIPLIKALSGLTVEQLKTTLDAVIPVLRQDDRSLEAWANIILDKERRTKQED